MPAAQPVYRIGLITEPDEPSQVRSENLLACSLAVQNNSAIDGQPVYRLSIMCSMGGTTGDTRIVKSTSSRQSLPYNLL